jgi:hypothetical protein
LDLKPWIWPLTTPAKETTFFAGILLPTRFRAGLAFVIVVLI